MHTETMREYFPSNLLCSNGRKYIYQQDYPVFVATFYNQIMPRITVEDHSITAGRTTVTVRSLKTMHLTACLCSICTKGHHGDMLSCICYDSTLTMQCYTYALL